MRCFHAPYSSLKKIGYLLVALSVVYNHSSVHVCQQMDKN